MEVQITGKNVEVSPPVREYLERKLSKVERLLPRVLEFKAELKQEHARSADDRFVAQVTVNIGGTLLRGETRAVNLFTAIDEVAEVMERQAQRFKGRLYDRKRPAQVRPAPAPQGETIIVRTKRFPVRPLAAEDAVEQMELLGHDFFLFVNPDSGQLNLVYRRKDGKYGLIEPAME